MKRWNCRFPVYIPKSPRLPCAFTTSPIYTKNIYVCVCVCERGEWVFLFVCLFTCSLRARRSSVRASRCFVYCYWRGPVRARRGDMFLALRGFIGAVIPLTFCSLIICRCPQRGFRCLLGWTTTFRRFWRFCFRGLVPHRLIYSKIILWFVIIYLYDYIMFWFVLLWMTEINPLMRQKNKKYYVVSVKLQNPYKW